MLFRSSRAVSVASSLLSDEGAITFVSNLKSEYERIRDQHANKKQVPLISIEQARANAQKIDWAHEKISVPKFLGRRVFKNYDLSEIASCIDWTPFFQTWDLAGQFPRILEDKVVGESAKKVYADAQAMLQKIIQGRWLSAQAVVGFYRSEEHTSELQSH